MYGNGSIGQPYGTAAQGIIVTGNTIGTLPSVVVDAAESVAHANQRLDALALQVRSIADAVFGSAPTGTAQGSAPQPPSSGKAENLRRATGSLQDIITLLESEVSRLGAL